MRTTVVRARIEPNLKHDVEAILHELGLTSSETIHLLYRQIRLAHGLPFDVRIPNRETREAMAEPMEKLPRYKSVKHLFKDLEG